MVWIFSEKKFDSNANAKFYIRHGFSSFPKLLSTWKKIDRKIAAISLAFPAGSRRRKNGQMKRQFHMDETVSSVGIITTIINYNQLFSQILVGSKIKESCL